jgi:ribosome biogenesis GTPase
MSGEGPGARAVIDAVVVRQDARACVVRSADGEERRCSVRGRVHLAGAVTAKTTLAVGDRVRVRPAGEREGAVEEVLPRTSVLSRPEPDRGRRRNVLRQHILAANVDRVAVVASAADPAFDTGLVDRVLTVAEWSKIPAIVVVNKADLVPREPEEIAVYRGLGYDVFATSVVTGRGIDDLRRALVGRTSVVTGHSGVGKSSLLNAVEPGLGLAVGRLNEVTGRGRQTTAAAVLVPLSGGGAVIDTPGVREFGLYNVPPKELTWLFRDLREVAPRCRFGDCLHRGDPGCAVPAAVAAGSVAPWRYASYLRLLATLPDVAPWSVPNDR